MPQPKKMVLAHSLGWGPRRFRHTPAPHPLPSTGQIKEICGWASDTFYLSKSAWELLSLLLVPSSLFREEKKKATAAQDA